MGVGSITSMNSMSNMQMARASSNDVKSKKIQNEITDLQQKIQKISSNEALSIDEKVNERKKQQQAISSLNTELKRHQEEILWSQKRELMMAELQEDKETAEKQGTVIFKNDDGTVILKEDTNQDEKRDVDADKKQTDETQKEDNAEKEPKTIAEDVKDANTAMPEKNVHAIISGGASAEQVSQQRAVIAKIRGGIAVLKGEINQDERHGINTDKKQAELEKLEKQEERAKTLRSSTLDGNNRTKNPMANIRVTGIQSRTEDKDSVNVSKLLSEETQASQQTFYVSLGN